MILPQKIREVKVFPYKNWVIQSRNDGILALRHIESIARICYQSGHRQDKDSWEKMTRMLLELGHHSMFEHAFMYVRVLTSRAIATELRTHRLASFAQESTRYVKYKDDAEMIGPNIKSVNNNAIYDIYERSFKNSVDAYKELIEAGEDPQDARDALPLALQAEIAITANLREWMHILKLRTAPGAHPNMIKLATGIKDKAREIVPILFDE